ncbi:NADH-quinone oxidoreductase subunit NuoN [Qipengyuania sediminis]|uniref:NADH-quinone oxidoreductase subunit NuoN n=1 Tax=Qipengyuania sediminis TaxID=1532023 RepID=UPI001059344B|nr:NADH-quinone oxidoreductase subunit NuoN [Qipengyuania sediminis]
MDFATSLYLTGAEIGLSLTGLTLLLVVAWTGARTARAVTILAAAALFGAAIFTAGALWRESPAADAFGGLYRVDAFGSFAKVLIYLATAACLMMTRRFFAERSAYRGEYPVLILFSAVGAGMMVSANDLMTLYIGLEMSSLSSYIFASFLRNDWRSNEAGLKYFILGALASGIILYGMSLVYGFAGTTSYPGIRAAFDGSFPMGALFGVVFVLAGAAFKIAAVPFHMWTPDVYEGAPTPVTAFFASAPKVAAVGMLMRLALGPFGGEAEAWRQIVVFVALASIVVGALGAIGQQNLKRLMAYSAINNIGFLLIGLACATPAGAASVAIYMAIYVAMTLGSFAALLMLQDAEGKPLETLADISGLWRTRPAIALCLLLLMFSLAGIPPLLGFYAKLVVFQAAVQAGLFAIAVIAVIGSVIGAFYYLKVIKVMMFDEPASAPETRSPAGHWTVLIACVLAISPLGYFATGWLGDVSGAAANALFRIA